MYRGLGRTYLGVLGVMCEPQPQYAYLALGSNLGDRERNLSRAKEGIERLGPKLIALSSIYETEPVGYHAQPWFLNQVVKVGVKKESPYYDNPTAFLHDLLELESRLGRQRTMPFGPRTVDIDLLLQDALIENFPTDDSLSLQTTASTEQVKREASSLVLPHPRFHVRRFVLEPLCEVEPGLVHPVFGVSCPELLSRLPQSGPVVRLRPVTDEKKSNP